MSDQAISSDNNPADQFRVEPTKHVVYDMGHDNRFNLVFRDSRTTLFLATDEQRSSDRHWVTLTQKGDAIIFDPRADLNPDGKPILTQEQAKFNGQKMIAALKASKQYNDLTPDQRALVEKFGSSLAAFNAVGADKPYDPLSSIQPPKAEAAKPYDPLSSITPPKADAAKPYDPLSSVTPPKADAAKPYDPLSSVTPPKADAAKPYDPLSSVTPPNHEHPCLDGKGAKVGATGAPTPVHIAHQRHPHPHHLHHRKPHRAHHKSMCETVLEQTGGKQPHEKREVPQHETPAGKQGGGLTAAQRRAMSAPQAH